MEKIAWKVEGMHCANCALGINKYLQGKGAKNVSVNAIDGDVSFEVAEKEAPQQLAQGIEQMGYKIKGEEAGKGAEKKPFLANHLQRFLFCLPFTAVLMLHMIPGLHIHFLMNPWIQLALTLPVFLVGMNFFGRSAVKSLRNGIPNMNVLISVGAIAAFVYSLTGAAMGLGDKYLFFETGVLSPVSKASFNSASPHKILQSAGTCSPVLICTRSPTLSCVFSMGKISSWWSPSKAIMLAITFCDLANAFNERCVD